MWDPQRLRTLWASMACYRDSFTFTVNVVIQVTIELVQSDYTDGYVTIERMSLNLCGRARAQGSLSGILLFCFETLAVAATFHLNCTVTCTFSFYGNRVYSLDLLTSLPTRTSSLSTCLIKYSNCKVKIKSKAIPVTGCEGP
jgi:hypothetical protein